MQMEGACSSSTTPAFQGGGRREGGQVEEKRGEGRKEGRPSLFEGLLLASGPFRAGPLESCPSPYPQPLGNLPWEALRAVSQV